MAASTAPAAEDAGWRQAVLVALGGFAGFMALLFFLLWAQADGPYETDSDAGVAVPLALLSALGLALARRKPAARLPWAGSTAVLAFFAAFALQWWLAAAAVAGLVAAAVLLRGATRLRAVALLPALWAAALLVSAAADVRPGFAPYSGMAILVLGLGYPLAWALAEPVRWARRMAWGAALGWSLLGAGLAVGDLGEFRDPLTVASAAVAGLAVLAVAGLWLLQARGLWPGAPGKRGPLAG